MFTWVSDTRILVTPPVPTGSTLRIQRVTPKDRPLADFGDGAIVTEINLDTNANQAVFIAAEAVDAATSDFQEVATTAIRLPSYETTINTLPVASERAGKYLAFNSLGNPIVLPSSGDAVLLREELNSTAGGTKVRTAGGLLQAVLDAFSTALSNAVSGIALAAGTGAALVGIRAAGTGAVDTNVQTVLRRSIHVDDFGAGTGVAATDTAAITAAHAAVVARGGGLLHFGAKTYYLNDTIVFNSGGYTKGVHWIGEGLATVIVQQGANKDLVKLGTTGILRRSGIHRMQLVSAPGAGHIMVFDIGCVTCEFNVETTQNNANKRIVYGDFTAAGKDGIYDTVFSGGDWELPGDQSSSVSPFYIRVNGTRFNENHISIRRPYSAGSAPFFDIQNIDLTTWLVNCSFDHVDFERCKGGGVRVSNARGWSFNNISFWDSITAYTGHLIHFCPGPGWNGTVGHASAGYESISNVLTNVTRNGDSLATGIRDVYTQWAQETAIVNCFSPSDINPSYDWADKRVVVTGRLLNELNASQRTLTRGDTVQTPSILSGITYSDEFHVGGSALPDSFRSVLSAGYISHESLINGQGQIWTNKSPLGVVTKMLFSSDESGSALWPLVTGRDTLGYTGQAWKSAHLTDGVYVNGTKVLGAQGTAIADPTDAASTQTAVIAILARMRAGTTKIA